MRILWRHVHDAVPDPASVRADVPPWLADLVREMLAKDPKARPQSMDAIVWRLQGPGSARGSAGDPARSRWRSAKCPDLLVIDLHLPRLSGVEVCRRLSATLCQLGFVQYVRKGDVLASKLPVIVRALCPAGARRVQHPRRECDAAEDRHRHEHDINARGWR
jgi:CheY-like chemotaxis protein